MSSHPPSSLTSFHIARSDDDDILSPSVVHPPSKRRCGPLHFLSAILVIGIGILTWFYMKQRLQGCDPAPSLLDSTQLNVYQLANGPYTLGQLPFPDVVMYGDSLTMEWDVSSIDPDSNRTFANRGIGGQTTPQLLLRAPQDIIALKPGYVFILGGINDLATSVGSDDYIVSNLLAVGELATANNITAILCSLLPLASYYSPNGLERYHIPQINALLQARIQFHPHLYYLDYYSSLVDVSGVNLNASYTKDGLHLNGNGYAQLNPIVRQFLDSL